MCLNLQLLVYMMYMHILPYLNMQFDSIKKWKDSLNLTTKAYDTLPQKDPVFSQEIPFLMTRSNGVTSHRLQLH